METNNHAPTNLVDDVLQECDVMLLAMEALAHHCSDTREANAALAQAYRLRHAIDALIGNMRKDALDRIPRADE